MKLRNCPFCGGGAFVRHVIEKSGDVYRVYCGNEDCWVEPRTHWYWKKEQAIEAWNRRFGDDLMERMEDDRK